MQCYVLEQIFECLFVTRRCFLVTFMHLGSCYYLQATQAMQVTPATVVSGSGAGECGNYRRVARGTWQ